MPDLFRLNINLCINENRNERFEFIRNLISQKPGVWRGGKIFLMPYIWELENFVLVNDGVYKYSGKFIFHYDE